MRWLLKRRAGIAPVLDALRDLERETARLPRRLGVSGAALADVLDPINRRLVKAKRLLQRVQGAAVEDASARSRVVGRVEELRYTIALANRRGRVRDSAGNVRSELLVSLQAPLGKLVAAAEAWEDTPQHRDEGLVDTLPEEALRAMAAIDSRLAKATTRRQLEDWYGELGEFGWDEPDIARRVALAYVLDQETFQSWEVRRRSRAPGRPLVHELMDTSLGDLLGQCRQLSPGSYVLVAKVPRWRMVWSFTKHA